MTLAPGYQLDYEPRSWRVYEVALDEAPAVGDATGISWCNSDSQAAKELADAPNRFYVDVELLAAEQDPSAGCQIGRLKESWQGHEPGTLAIISYEKIRDRILVVLVEDTARGEA